MKILELLKLKTKTKESAENNDIILGDGGAEFLGAGTYEDYEKELDENKSWSKVIARRLKIDL